jgi:hypothetical protein
MLDRARLHTGIPRHERAARSSFVELSRSEEALVPSRRGRSVGRVKSA